MCTSPGMQPLAGQSAARVRVATSTDHGASFTTKRVDDLSGPGRSIGASPGLGQTESVCCVERLRRECHRLQPVCRWRQHLGSPRHHLAKKLFRLILAYPPSRFAARLSIPHWTLIVRAEFIVQDLLQLDGPDAGKHYRHFHSYSTMVVRPGQPPRLLQISFCQQWIGSTIGCRLIR